MNNNAQSSSGQQVVQTVSPRFKWTVIVCLIIELVFVVIAVGLAMYGDTANNLSQKELFDASLTITKIGAGAIFGLLGGKTL